MANLQRPAFDADERTALLGWFQLQREIVGLKAQGLAEADVHRIVIESSPLMTIGGVLSHLRWAEHLWFQVAFAGVDEAVNPGFVEDPEDNDFLVAQDKSLAELIAEYEEECRRSDEVIASNDLDDPGAGTAFRAAGATLRWMVIHMLEETARHAGHLDIIRERLDGEKSYF